MVRCDVFVGFGGAIVVIIERSKWWKRDRGLNRRGSSDGLRALVISGASFPRGGDLTGM